MLSQARNTVLFITKLQRSALLTCALPYPWLCARSDRGRAGDVLECSTGCGAGNWPKDHICSTERGENMKRLLKVALAVCVLSFAFITSAHAQATRTWVSGVGDDANPCSRTAPCKTFAGAISKPAASGEIDALDPGGFGSLTITKAITIDGGGQLAGVLVSGTNGITVSAGATDTVVLRHLAFSGIGSGLDGVQITSAGNVVIDHCTFQGFTVNDIEVSLTNSGYVLVQDSTITGGDKGINVITATTGPDSGLRAREKRYASRERASDLQTIAWSYRRHSFNFYPEQSWLWCHSHRGLHWFGGQHLFRQLDRDPGSDPGAQINISNVDIVQQHPGHWCGWRLCGIHALNNHQFNNTTPGAPTGTMLTQ